MLNFFKIPASGSILVDSIIDSTIYSTIRFRFKFLAPVRGLFVSVFALAEKIQMLL
jgi:hypothetical protein